MRINDLTNTFSTLDFCPDIIGLSETKITAKANSHYNPCITGYNFFQSQSSTCSGSVGVFVKNSFVVKIRNDLDITVPGLFETIFVDIEHENRRRKLHSELFIGILDSLTFRFFKENLNLPLKS